MIENKKLLSAAETATLLRQQLGPIRQWRDFLADCIRERTNLEGEVLLPYAALEGGTNKVPRPLYRAPEVVEFIRRVRAKCPAARPAPLTTKQFALETTAGLPWRMRIARPSSGGMASL